MKRGISLVLSLLIVISATFIIGGSTISAETASTPVNLLTNPELNYTGNATDGFAVEGWSFNKKATMSTEANGDNVLTIATTDTNNGYDLRPTAQLNLDSKKYYKFSVLYKLTDPPSGNFNISNGVFLSYKYNDKYVNKVNLTKATEWTEASFIVYGGNVTAGAWNKYFTVTSNYSRCTLSIKNPSVTEYNPDELEMKDSVQAANILETIPATMADFTAACENTSVIASQSDITTNLNGKEVVAKQVVLNKANNFTNIAYWLWRDSNKNYKLTNGVKYKFTVWVKGENITYNNESGYGIRASFCNGNTWSNGTVCQTFGEWQKLEYIIDQATFQWQYRIVIRTYAIGGTVLVAEPRLELLVPTVSVENDDQSASNVLSDGNFEENFNTETNKFTDWTHWNDNNVNNVVARADGVSGYALKLNNVTTDRLPTIAKTVTIDPTKDYTLSAKVKVTKTDNDEWGSVSWGGGVRIEIVDTKTAQRFTIIKTNEINSITDGWVDLRADINNLPIDVTSVKVRIATGSTKCNAYFDDIKITPKVAGEIVANRSNANSGDEVQVKVNTNDGYFLKRLYYTDGVTETDITAKKQTVSGTNNTYTSVASDKVYTFTTPAAEGITIKAEYYLYGDLSDDGKCNVLDLVRLKAHLSDDSVEIKPDHIGETAVKEEHLTLIRNLLLGL